MTYEQAGGGRAGLGIENDENITLTLKDRIEHHYTTGISTVEIAALNKTALNENYQQFYQNEALKYQNFVLEGNADKLNALNKLLNKHDIQSYRMAKDVTVKGYDYQKQKIAATKFTSDALIVPTNQPKGKMAQVLLEPQTKLNDSLTYDITSWSLPYAFGLKAIATKLNLERSPHKIENRGELFLQKDMYGYALEYKSLEDGKFLSALLKEGLGVRYNKVSIINSGKAWDRGSLFILKGDNQKKPNYLDKVAQLAAEFNRKLTPIETGYSSSGPDLGSAEL